MQSVLNKCQTTKQTNDQRVVRHISGWQKEQYKTVGVSVWYDDGFHEILCNVLIENGKRDDGDRRGRTVHYAVELLW